MEIGWISAIMTGDGIDPLEDEAVILLPAGNEKIEAYLCRHQDAVVYDLQDNEGVTRQFWSNMAALFLISYPRTVHWGELNNDLILDDDKDIYAYIRTLGDEKLIVYCNFRSEEHTSELQSRI